MAHESLEIIDLDIPELGYKKFISSWLYRGPVGNFLVDPGPTCTIPVLLTALEERNVESLDWILLTHIHQDHAGGLGQLIKKYPKAKVVVHPSGASHLAEPSKLLVVSRKILREVSEVYGVILPVPGENINVLDRVPFGSGIKVIPTPGHASHHQCYVFKNWFFAGELFGAHLPSDQGLYLRPATPQRFILEDYLTSMELVEPYLTDTICFAHYGSIGNSKTVLATARKQLQLWVRTIDEHREMRDMDALMRLLMEKDGSYVLYQSFEPDTQNREREFSINSIKGILEYLEFG
jgi:glyoxylase-like metal-dependent hydrolase (beta-lactamase superfamily II)